MDENPPPEPPTEDVSGRLAALERVLGPVLRPGNEALRAVSDRVVVPAWQRATGVESRVPAMAALAVAIVLMAVLPVRVANHPRWLLPGLASVLFVIVLLVNPSKTPERALRLRPLTFALLVVVSLGNAASAARLIVDLANGEGIRAADTLLLTGAAIWTTNMIIFAVWYWEFDRGGPGARALAIKPLPDFLFPQMTSPEFAPDDWEPHFVDYLYLSFTNATAFSPTDVMPLARWTKLAMLGQSVVSLTTVVLVVARAVNILR